MARILIEPESLMSWSNELKSLSRQIQEINSRMNYALSSLSWETHARVTVEREWAERSAEGRKLADATQQAAQYLEMVYRDFLQADGQQSGGFSFAGFKEFFKAVEHGAWAATMGIPNLIGKGMSIFGHELVKVTNPSSVSHAIEEVGSFAGKVGNFFHNVGHGIETGLKEAGHDIVEGYHAVTTAAGNWIREHGETIKTISKVVGTVSTVAAIGAAVTFWCPPVSGVLEGVALGGSVAKMGMDTALVAAGAKDDKGHALASKTEVLWDVADIGLSTLPGIKGVNEVQPLKIVHEGREAGEIAKASGSYRTIGDWWARATSNEITTAEAAVPVYGLYSFGAVKVGEKVTEGKEEN